MYICMCVFFFSVWHSMDVTTIIWDSSVLLTMLLFFFLSPEIADQPLAIKCSTNARVCVCVCVWLLSFVFLNYFCRNSLLFLLFFAASSKEITCVSLIFIFRRRLFSTQPPPLHPYAIQFLIQLLRIRIREFVVRPRYVQGCSLFKCGSIFAKKEAQQKRRLAGKKRHV